MQFQEMPITRYLSTPRCHGLNIATSRLKIHFLMVNFTTRTTFRAFSQSSLYRKLAIRRRRH